MPKQWTETHKHYKLFTHTFKRLLVTIRHLHSTTSKRKQSNAAYRKKKKTPWPLVRKRTIPTERPPLVDEI
jgi:hypothetical protein